MQMYAEALGAGAVGWCTVTLAHLIDDRHLQLGCGRI
jgi:hypothetical protein